MDVNQYLEVFVDESKEHIEELNNSLLEIEKNPEDKDLIDSIFRVSHTLKGMAATMGFSKLGELAHKMEDVLSEVRAGNLIIDTKVIDILLKCADMITDSINNVEASGNEGDINTSEVIAELENLVGKKPDIETANIRKPNIANLSQLDEYEKDVMEKALKDGFNCYKLDIYVIESCILKSARAYVVFNTLDKLGEIFKTIPSTDDIEDEKFDDSFTIFIITKEDKSTITKSVVNIAEIEKCESTDLRVENINNASQDEKTKIIKPDNIKHKNKKRKTTKTIRVDADRLDKLMNLVSELIIIKTRLFKIQTSLHDSDLDAIVEYLDRITTNLNDAVMKVRMVPVERVFNRFPRMVRDLSREVNKEIELKMSGEDTEVDRAVIDELGEPLIHLIRNSIDHGIEATEDRKKIGKTAKGTVYLRAFQAGNNVVIEVEDDGSGIDYDKVKQSAIKKNLVDADSAESLSEHDIVNFLFLPGFSTSKKVTDISGRGVGLDVVKNKIESMGGFIEVETKRNIGTTFSIKLPLTLSIIQALLITLGNEIYAIPLNSIKEIVNIDKKDIKVIQGSEIMMIRGDIVQLIKLGEVLGVPGYSLPESKLTAVITKHGDKYFGILVDSLIGQQEIVIKSLGKYLANIKSIAGATILGDGDVALIVDTNFLFK